MPLTRRTLGQFQRKLMAGVSETITLIKRGNDQQMGTQVVHTIFNARRSRISKSGEQIAIDETVNHTTTWHIPLAELKRVGVTHINSADRIVQRKAPEAGWTWQPEATTSIELKMFGEEIDISCLRTDPPMAQAGGVG